MFFLGKTDFKLAIFSLLLFDDFFFWYRSMNGHHSHKELYYDVSDETDSDSDDFDQDDIPEFKMVFVVNTSLDMGPGKVFKR